MEEDGCISRLLKARDSDEQRQDEQLLQTSFKSVLSGLYFETVLSRKELPIGLTQPFKNHANKLKSSVAACDCTF